MSKFSSMMLKSLLSLAYSRTGTVYVATPLSNCPNGGDLVQGDVDDKRHILHSSSRSGAYGV